jgi:DNA-binding NtrC family response regulator
MTTPSADPPMVVTLGCTEVVRPLRALGFATAGARNLAALRKPKTELHARVILINRTALEDTVAADVIEELRRVWPLVDIVIWARNPGAGFVREALRAGARDVLLTSAPAAVAKAVGEIVAQQQLLPRATRLGTDTELESTFEGMVSRNAKMWDLFDTASQVAPTDAAILLLGETGTGKELFARAIHRRSNRTGRFVAVNCAAVAEDLIDSELFGHVSGAFTGANRDKDGLMRYAEAGTLMLDEIGTIKLAGQHRLLRALQEGTVRPVGGHREVPINVRIIAATSVPLEDEVESGRFREDLFYRLDVIRIEVPPLRERPEDIMYLFGHFVRKFATQYNVERPSLAPGFLDALSSYDWPGNVRQLENVTERLLLTSPGGRLTAGALRKVLPFKRQRQEAASKAAVAAAPTIDAEEPMRAALAPHIERLERRYLEACLRRTRGRIGAAATRAGISRRTLLRKLKRYDLDKSLFKSTTSGDGE